MSLKYKNLLSPIKVRNVILKNRLISSNSQPHFIQGPETWPADPLIEHMVGLARNGAAVVTFSDWTDPNQRNSGNEDGKRFAMFDINDPSMQNYMCKLADLIHYYNSKISICIMPFFAKFPGYDVSASKAKYSGELDSVSMFYTDEGDGGATLLRDAVLLYQDMEELTHEMIRETIEDQVQRIKFYKDMGFDMCTLHFAYGVTLFARFLSPAFNHRTDKYGGSVAGRCQFLKEFATRIREVCGEDFLIEVEISGSEEEKGGYDLNEFIEIGKELEGYVDIFQIRHGSANVSHPTGFNSYEHHYATLEYAEAMKKAGINILAEVIGGYQMADEAEEIIASGKADLIGGARMFFVDGEFYQKLKEGRGEDILPCMRCNKCHVPSMTNGWLFACSVNPKIGLMHELDQLVEPVGEKKRVAIIGGGPAGMRASLFCAERGHDVTLYEKTGKLGGQLYHADHASFKWTVRRYRDWVAAQMEKAGVKVLLNTEASPDMIADAGYDAVIVALGATPKKPPIEGAENTGWNPMNIYGNADKLGHHVAVVGGSENAVEIAFYLCENGHEVTILSRKDVLAYDATPVHYRETMVDIWRTLPQLHQLKNVTTTYIGTDCVKYVDAEGAGHTVACDDVVALGGMQPLQDEALAYFGCADQFFMIGDCNAVGTIRECNRTAFAAASQI